MDSAEVYMTLIRPSMVPVFGEAAPLEFTGQVELNNWSWTLKNADEDTRAREAAKDYNERSSFQSTEGSLNIRAKIEGLNDKKRLLAAQKARKKAEDALDKRYKDDKGNFLPGKQDKWQQERDSIRTEFEKGEEQAAEDQLIALVNLGQVYERDKIKRIKEEDAAIKAVDEQIKEMNKDAEEANRNKNFEFTFSKRVDIATTQMLNSMKAGDLFPVAILTLHQRAAKFNHGASLIITVEKLRLLEYQLKCEVSETMTDMREEWTAEFFSLAYVYKNRGQIKTEKAVGQAITAALTQGTVRTFTMKNSSLPSLPI